MSGNGKPKKQRAKQRAGTTPALVPRPNGQGALLAGGMPGNRGGSGAPPSVLRERLRAAVADRATIIEDILDDKEVSTADRIRAMDLALRYGIGPKTDDSVSKAELAHILRQFALAMEFEIEDRAVIERIYERWSRMTVGQSLALPEVGTE